MTEKKNSRSRGWCFTINNYTDDDIAECMALYEDSPKVLYVCIGFEVGKDGTPHIQGYAYFQDPIKFNKIKGLLTRAHIDDQKASKNVTSWVYCRKDGKEYEMGDRPRQGFRTDLEDIRLDLHKGVSLDQVMKTNFNQWVFHRRAFREYQEAQGLLPKYDTQMIQYNEHDGKSYEIMYEDYNSKLDLIVSDVMHPPQIMAIYKSGKYKRIYLPSFNIPNWMSVAYVNNVI